MEGVEGKPQRGIPRLSRLPVPHATAVSHSYATDSARNDGTRPSQIPRFSESRLTRPRVAVQSIKKLGQQPLSEHKEEQVKRHPSQLHSPVTSTFLSHDSVQLEATPPSKSFVSYAESDENSRIPGSDVDVDKPKRKPRPSLSERTLETLSQIPPSPSPSRRRLSVTSNHGSMQPPSTPMSSLRAARSHANLTPGLRSPSKRSNKPVIQSHPPLDEQQSLSNAPEHDRDPTASGSFRKTLKPTSGVPYPEVKHDKVSVRQVKKSLVPHSPVPSIPRIKSKSELRAVTSMASLPPPSAASLHNNSIGLSMEACYGPSRRKSPIEPHLSSIGRPSSLAPSKEELKVVQRGQDTFKRMQTSRQESQRTTLKSSITLKDTIAKARAAKQDSTRKHVTSSSGTTATVSAERDYQVLEENTSGNNSRSLHNRIKGAVTTGVLNIAAMNLTTLPDDIKKMHEFDQDSHMNWSEAVDLVKLIAADNNIEGLPDLFFPDWSRQELEDDDEKVNQFGGLQILDFRQNSLNMLPNGLKRLELLQTLNLSNNKLQLDSLQIICQLPRLKELYLGNNKLEGSVPESFFALTELQVLDLHGNSLQTLPDNVQKLRELQKLNISNNAFAELPLQSMQKLPLVEVNISANAMTGTLLSSGWSVPRLQILNMSYNNLHSICDGDLELPALQILICDNNKLAMLPEMAQLQSLSMLTASGNKIEALPLRFTKLKCIRSVDLSNNYIKLLDPEIAHMEDLAVLNVAGNPLREKKYLSMATDKLKADLARNAKVDGIDTDDMASEHPEYINGERSGATNATYKVENGILNLEYCNLTSLTTSMVTFTEPVRSLRLSHNKLTSFPIELLSHPMIKSSLKSIDISHNQMLHPTQYLGQNIELPALQSLDIVSTGLASLEALASCLTSPLLKELNISFHRLVGPLPQLRASFPSLTTLLATDNRFTSVEVESMRGLEVVDLSNNNIDYLPPKIGELGNLDGKKQPGRLQTFSCAGNRFRVPRVNILEKGTEAILRDLRRMVPTGQIGDEWIETQ